MRAGIVVNVTRADRLSQTLRLGRWPQTRPRRCQARERKVRVNPLGAKSFKTVIQIQSEYAKTSYAAFVAQAFKMGELYSNLAKAGFKPAELAIANMQGMQGTQGTK